MEEGARASTRQRRRRLHGALALAAVILLPAAVWLRAHPPDELLADLRTGTGQQRSVVLADGSRVTLASASAANVHLESGQRRLNLMRGELLIDVAKEAARPFVVETGQGRIQALGTRFIVRTDGGTTWLTMIESRTAVRTASGERDVVVRPGERIRLNGEVLERLDDVSPGLVEDAFRQRRLLVQDRPLSEVLDELARHRPGVMRFDRDALQAVRVSAVLPLDDTDRALQLLSIQFPQLKVRTATRWVTWIDVRS